MKLMINESNEDFDMELYDSLYDYCDDIEAELNKYSGKSYDELKSFMERNGFHFEESNGLAENEHQEMWSKYYDGNLVTVDLWFDIVKGDRRRSVGDFLRCSANFELYKRYGVTESLNESYKDYWAYKEVSNNWESDVAVKLNGKQATVVIWYDKKDRDVYAKFKIEQDDGFWYVYDITDGKNQMINDEIELDEENGNLDDAVKSCFYYFHTRY